MELSQQQKEQQGAEAVNEFLKQFGTPDVYTRVLLEEVFSIILGKSNVKDISVSRPKGQEGTPGVKRSPGSAHAPGSSQRSETPESPTSHGG